MNKILKIILLIVASILVIGCGGNTGLPISMSNPKLNKPVLANGVINMPKDAAKVILAISARILKSKKKIRDVIFQQPFNSRLVDAKLFAFKNAILISYKNDTKREWIDADLFFEDSIGRSISYNITASYINGNKISVSNFKITDRFANNIKTVCFILPANIYMKLNRYNFPKNFYKLYRYAAQNAITTEEAMRYRDKSDWAIIVFSLDRISKSAKMILGISDNKDSYDSEISDNTKYINYGEWKVGVAVGNFHLLKPDSMRRLYAKVIYEPGKESHKSLFFKKQKIVGLYKIQ